MEDNVSEPIRGAGSMPASLSRAIVDATAHSFVVIDSGGTITYASGSIHRLSGWLPTQLIGRNMIEFIAPAEQERAITSFSALTTATTNAVNLPIVFEALKPTGEPIWLEIGAMRCDELPDVGDFDGTVFRLRGWSHNHYFNLFLEALLASEPFPDVAGPLCESIRLALFAQGALLHHGFDGSRFLGADGTGVPRSCAPIDEGPWREAARQGRPVYATIADLPPRARLAAEEPGYAAIWCAPIEGTEGRVRAVLSVWRTEPGPPQLGEVAGLQVQTSYAQLAVQRWAEHQRLIHIAGHDSLTGVANRISFRDGLAEALAIGEENIAVAFCDLDSFKPVNDTYGHQTGDRVLVEVAGRLRTALRIGDELARLGGDEFTVLMRNVTDSVAALNLAERLIAATSEPFDADGNPVDIGISVGVALVREPVSADEILALADNALYAAKAKGGNRAHVAET